MSLTRSAARTLCAANAQMGLRASDARLDVQIDQAMARLIRFRNWLVRREEYDLAPITHNPAIDPLQLDAPDALKLMVLALWREENDEQDMARGLESRAQELIQQDIVQSVEATNKSFFRNVVASQVPYSRSWYAGKLGLDTEGGLAVSFTKLKRYVQRAADWIIRRTYEIQLIERNRVHEAPPTRMVQPSSDTTAMSPALDYEILKLVAQAMLLEGTTVASDAGPQQRAMQFYQEAETLLTRELQARLEELRHGEYTTDFNSYDSDTFGAVVAQLGLELPMGLKLSRVELKRLVNSAERRLVESGKWKNAIADFEITITESGEVDMPPQVETVLGATLCNTPTLIKGRWYEVSESGPGRVSGDCAPRGLLVDRGEVVVEDVRRRRYFVGACPGGEQTLMVRAKRRFMPHTDDDDEMLIRNYSAIKAAAQTLIHEGFIGVDNRDPGLASFYWKQALQILSDELVEHVGDSATPSMPVQGVGFSPASMEYVL